MIIGARTYGSIWPDRQVQPEMWQMKKTVQPISVTTANSAKEKKDLYIWGVQSNGFESLYAYTITGDGEIRLRHTVLPQGRLPLWLPRIGLTLTLDKSLDQVRWYGRGPEENYPQAYDREITIKPVFEGNK